MIIDQDNNTIYFDNDDEFYEYCVNLDMVAKVRGRCVSYGWDFTEWYYSHVDEKTKIVILDGNSTILRRNGVVSGRGGVCKTINAYRALGPKRKQILIKVKEEE